MNGINKALSEMVGEGKRITSMSPVGAQMSPDQRETPEWERLLFGVETDQPDGSKTQSYISRNRSSDPKDPYPLYDCGRRSAY